MSQYLYFARDASSRSVNGVLFAADEQHLSEALDGLGLVLVECRQVTRLMQPLWQIRVRRHDLIQFSIQLATLLEAGVSLLSGLRDLADQSGNKRFKQVISDIERNIKAGATLSDALAGYPDVFPELYVSVVRAGEATGNVHQVLNDLAEFMDWQEELASNSRRAAIYPALVLCAVTGLILLLMGYVFPRFMEIFEYYNVALPLPTVIVVRASRFVVSYWSLMLLGLFGISALFTILYAYKPTRRRLDGLILSLPVVGDLVVKINMARFAHYFAMLLHAGVSVVTSLYIIERVIGNMVFAQLIAKARTRVQAGEPVSATLAESKIVPGMMIRMLAVGEAAGEPEKTLRRVAEYYNREIPRTMEKIFAIMGPAVVVVLGLLVGLVALAVLLPIYRIQEALPM